MKSLPRNVCPTPPCALLRPAARVAAAIGAALMVAAMAFGAGPSANVVMPAPAEAQWAGGRFAVTPAVTFAVSGPDDGRVHAALARMAWQWEQRAGFAFARTSDGALTDAPSAGGVASVTVACAGLAAPVPTAAENESYTLDVAADHVRLAAPTTTGALRGLATLTQMLQSDHAGWFLATGSIQDAPRFAWRGLLLDPARRWIPVEGIKRTIDGMALVKLNVLHLHLTDDQGFRIESMRLPRLQTLGSDGNYYTQEQMRGIIGYAAARGIRVVPEFEMPGHSTTWAVAYPELASAPGPYAIERHFGVHDVVLDPTNEALYPLLDQFLGEMATLFPDAYVHIGGDENNGRQWGANAHIQAFMRAHGLKDNAALQAYFNRRLEAIVTRHGKKMIGWDEILHRDLPAGTVIQSWRGPDGMAEAARMNFPAILSNGYYLDHLRTAAVYYANDPMPAVPLSPAQQRLILGGEACLWGEWATAETLDARAWPRSAAIAERLWSPRTVIDVDDMYRRLDLVSQRLEEAGLRHRTNRDAMLRRFAGSSAAPAVLRQLKTLADVFASGSLDNRVAAQPDATQFTPLTEFADCANAESRVDRDFDRDVRALISATEPRSPAAVQALAATLTGWEELGDAVASQRLAAEAPRVCALAPLGRTLAEAARIGRAALEDLGRGGADPATAEKRRSQLTALGKTQLGVTLPIIAPLQLLVGGEAAR